MAKKHIIKNAFLGSLLLASILIGTPALMTSARDESEKKEDKIGGGYAASDQMTGASYMTQVYDASNGLYTSDANYILSASDGTIWVGGYSGILKYDGFTFERLDTSEGLTSGRGLFEDKRRRIWVATNDNGVVVIDGEKRTHYTYKDGLPSSSIRTFAEGPDDDIYIGTTAGVCFVDASGNLHEIKEPRLAEERVLRLVSDASGRIFGQTGNGIVFEVKKDRITQIFKSADLGMEKITTILADPKNSGKLYFGTESSNVYYGNFGDSVENLKKISVAPMDTVHWLNFDCGKIWVSSLSQMGYIQDDSVQILNDFPVDSGLEMVTADYQGNLWVASSTKGVAKIVADSFIDLFQRCRLEEEVTNVTCLYQDKLYVGTDRGIRIIDKDHNVIEDELTSFIGSARVRCICTTDDGSLWLSTYTDDLGIVCQDASGQIKNYTMNDGLPENKIRCLIPGKDGSLIAGTNGGLAIIKNNQVTKTVGVESGIKNTVFLTVCEGDRGEIYAGTDGDGIYVIKDDKVTRIGRDNGLTSDVVMRIKKDEKNDLYWIVTSNSIQYMKQGQIKEVTTFPYNNNYDLYFDDQDHMWIISSYGIITVPTEDVLNDKVTDYRLYTTENGVTTTPTSNSYSAKSPDGNLYIPGRTGVCKVDINHVSKGSVSVRTAINSIWCGDERILADKKGKYIIPSFGGRIRIMPSVLDYSMINPLVKVYIEGREEDGIETSMDNLFPLEYTGLAYGDYILHIQAFDNAGKELADDTYQIEKKASFTELLIFRILAFAAVALLAGIVVWRFMHGTVVKRQFEEIKAAKEEAERANVAKTRFLANMSHEIRTPINTIMGMNEMALREDAAGVPKPYFMSMMGYSLDIREASETLLSLINDLLDMSKIESGKMHVVNQEYDIQELIRSIVAMIRVRSTEKQLTFDVIIDEALPKRMYGDVQKIKQIVLNLLTNAVKYTEKGGFALEVSMTERHDENCMLKFSVKDTGIGVKEEDMDKLFAAYERLDEEKNSGIQGTGLGLDISRRFAELMGGSLTCESEYGKGSEFILCLEQKIVDKTPMGVFVERDETKSKGAYVPKFIAPDADILVVDDTPMNLNVMKGLLKPTKVFVTTASNGEECLEKIKETHFDVVLLDHMMPGMDGIETMERIRQIDKDLVIYALTANTAVDESFYISKGFNGYLAKPVDSELLESTLMKHIPDKIMEKPDSVDESEVLTEMPDNMKWIYETEGITAEDGIKNSGGIENYIFSLGLFYDTIDDNAKVISDAYESDNIRLYTIKVHALKSSARIIGAKELSLLAEKLEEAGNKEDKAFIDEKTPVLLEEYEKFKDKLKQVHEEPDKSDKPMIPDDVLKDAYSALAEVIPQMDYDSVEMILDSLSEYQLYEEDEKKISEIAKLLKVFDWDGLEAVILE